MEMDNMIMEMNNVPRKTVSPLLSNIDDSVYEEFIIDANTVLFQRPFQVGKSYNNTSENHVKFVKTISELFSNCKGFLTKYESKGFEGVVPKCDILFTATYTDTILSYLNVISEITWLDNEDDSNMQLRLGRLPSLNPMNSSAKLIIGSIMELSVILLTYIRSNDIKTINPEHTFLESLFAAYESSKPILKVAIDDDIKRFKMFNNLRGTEFPSNAQNPLDPETSAFLSFSNAVSPQTTLKAAHAILMLDEISTQFRKPKRQTDGEASLVARKTQKF